MKIRESLGMLWASRGMIPLLFKGICTLLFHPKIIRKWKKAPEGYDPKPRYEIPKYESWMKINNSNELYLRPTKSCESTAPEIIALAYKVGAYRKSDLDYTNSVFEWVKNNIKLSFGGGTALETLEEGNAFCIQQANLIIALCRAGGLKARFRVTPSIRLDEKMENFVRGMVSMFGLDEVLTPLVSDALTTWPIHELAEVQVDGRWIPVDPTFQDELEAAAGYPISKLGDDPLESWMKGSKKFYYMEDAPRALRPLFLYFKSMLGIQYKIEKILDQSVEVGREILEEVGGKEKYNEKLKKPYEKLKGEIDDMMKEVM